MTYLCDALAIPYMAQHALNGEVIVIFMCCLIESRNSGCQTPRPHSFFEDALV